MSNIHAKYLRMITDAKTGIIKNTRGFYCIHVLYDDDLEEYVPYIGRALFGIRKLYNKDVVIIPLKNSSYKKKKYLGKEKITSTIECDFEGFKNLKIFESYKDAEFYLKLNTKKEDYFY